jgi:hypothetical protein
VSPCSSGDCIERYKAGIVANAQEKLEDDLAEERCRGRHFSSSHSDEPRFDRPEEGTEALRSRLEFVRQLEQPSEMEEESPVPGEDAEAILYAVDAHTEKVDIEELSFLSGSRW